MKSIPTPIRSLGLALLVAFGLGRTAPAAAAPNDDRPKILLHVRPAGQSEPCQAGLLDDCRYAETSARVAAGRNGPFYYVYLLAARGRMENISRLRCGINYQKGRPGGQRDGRGVDILGWNLCADIQFASPVGPLWPAPGSGSIVYWDGAEHCQRGEVAVAGYFYMAAYDPDTLRVIADPTDRLVDLFKCDPGSEFLGPEDLGYVTFSAGGGEAGCNPCKEDCSGLPPPADFRPPSLLLHVSEPVNRRQACPAGQLSDCSAATTSGALVTSPQGPFYFVYLVAHQGNVRSIGGFRCGIDYELGRPGDIDNGAGLDVFEWSLCADHAILNTALPPWPSPGGGITAYWDTPAPASRSVAAVAGYFYVGAYGGDTMRLTKHGIFRQADLFERNFRSTPLAPAALGSATFSPGAKGRGCNPCREDCLTVTPVRSTTWSAIKGMYGK